MLHNQVAIFPIHIFHVNNSTSKITEEGKLPRFVLGIFLVCCSACEANKE
jgi:hypothetical protein